MRKFYFVLLLVFTSISFFGQCPAISDFSESFDASDQLPDCWSSLRVNPPVSPFAVVEVQTDPAKSFSPPNSVRMFNQLGATADFYLISPKVDNLDDGTHQLRFVYKGNPNGSGLDAIIEVGTMTDPADENTFTLVETLSSTSEAFQEYTVPFNQISTDQYIAIKADFQVTFRNLYFDDVIWEAMPTCPKPTGLQALNITSTSADLSWTAGGSENEWDIIYGDTGFDPLTEGTTITDSDGNPEETIQNLGIGTDYEFYVKAICGAGDESVLSFVGAFTTLCDIFPLDYVQDFSTFIPNCWDEADAGNPTTGPSVFGSSNWTNSSYLNDASNGPATKIILFGNSISDWLLSPEIDITGLAELTYNVGFTTLNGTTPPSGMGADDQVQVLITADGGITWESLKTYDNNGFPPATGITETIDLSAYSGTVQFAFWATDGSVADSPETYDVFFDNFEVNAVIIPCVDPSEIAVGNISTTSATASWTENGTAISWEVIYGLEGFDPLTAGNPETVNDTPELEITNLSPDTAYDVYVKAICGPTDTSALVGPISFTTEMLGVNNETIESLVFYPNPVNDQLTVRASSNIDDVIIYNMTGQVIYRAFIGKTETQIEISDILPGIYLMRLTSNGKTQTVKLVKE